MSSLYQYKARTYFNHYPFGMGMQGRSFSIQGRYRYGFNGKEKDSEIASDNYDFGARIYDGRLGRWLAIDPHYFKYPELNGYNYCENSPIIYYDPNGKDALITIDYNTKTIKVSSVILVYGKDASAEIVNKYQEEVNKIWNKNSFSVQDDISKDNFTVTFDIQFKLLDPENPTDDKSMFHSLNPGENYAEVNNDHPDLISTDPNVTIGGSTERNQMILGTESFNIKAVGHEVGHLLDLDERYTEEKQKDGTIKIVDMKGWENNIMGTEDGNDGVSGSGDVDVRNVKAILRNTLNSYSTERIAANNHNFLVLACRKIYGASSSPSLLEELQLYFSCGSTISVPGVNSNYTKEITNDQMDKR